MSDKKSLVLHLQVYHISYIFMYNPCIIKVVETIKDESSTSVSSFLLTVNQIVYEMLLNTPNFFLVLLWMAYIYFLLFLKLWFTVLCVCVCSMILIRNDDHPFPVFSASPTGKVLLTKHSNIDFPEKISKHRIIGNAGGSPQAPTSLSLDNNSFNK